MRNEGEPCSLSPRGSWLLHQHNPRRASKASVCDCRVLCHVMALTLITARGDGSNPQHHRVAMRWWVQIVPANSRSCRVPPQRVPLELSHGLCAIAQAGPGERPGLAGALGSYPAPATTALLPRTGMPTDLRDEPAPHVPKALPCPRVTRCPGSVPALHGVPTSTLMAQGSPVPLGGIHLLLNYPNNHSLCTYKQYSACICINTVPH